VKACVVTKFGEVVQRVRNPPGQGVANQVGSESCDGEGNDAGDAYLFGLSKVLAAMSRLLGFLHSK
jgi:hypothetical protein